MLVPVALPAAAFAISMLSIGLVFMRLSDRVNQRVLFVVAALVQVVGIGLNDLIGIPKSYKDAPSIGEPALCPFFAKTRVGLRNAAEVLT